MCFSRTIIDMIMHIETLTCPSVADTVMAPPSPCRQLDSLSSAAAADAAAALAVWPFMDAHRARLMRAELKALAYAPGLSPEVSAIAIAAGEQLA